jgi:serine/threonine protein kinase
MQGFGGGMTLEARIRQCREAGPAAEYPAELRKRHLAMVALALDRLHARGLSHGNISSRNVVIRGEQALLGGQMPECMQSAYRNRSSDDYKYYLSPEAEKGAEHDRAADMWAVGVLFREVATLADKDTAGAVAGIGGAASTEA